MTTCCTWIVEAHVVGCPHGLCYYLPVEEGDVVHKSKSFTSGYDAVAVAFDDPGACMAKSVTCGSSPSQPCIHSPQAQEYLCYNYLPPTGPYNCP